MIYRVCVKKYGYADIMANSADEAISMANDDMFDKDFDWSELCDAEIVEEFEAEEYEEPYKEV